MENSKIKYYINNKGYQYAFIDMDDVHTLEKEETKPLENYRPLGVAENISKEGIIDIFENEEGKYTLNFYHNGNFRDSDADVEKSFESLINYLFNDNKDYSKLLVYKSKYIFDIETRVKNK